MAVAGMLPSIPPRARAHKPRWPFIWTTSSIRRSPSASPTGAIRKSVSSASLIRARPQRRSMMRNAFRMGGGTSLNGDAVLSSVSGDGPVLRRASYDVGCRLSGEPMAAEQGARFVRECDRPSDFMDGGLIGGIGQAVHQRPNGGGERIQRRDLDWPTHGPRVRQRGQFPVSLLRHPRLQLGGNRSDHPHYDRHAYDARGVHQQRLAPERQDFRRRRGSFHGYVFYGGRRPARWRTRLWGQRGEGSPSTG